MKLSVSWLREWVNYSLTEKDLAAQLTMAGLEVDSIHPVAGEFTQVIVAQVLATKPHPNADKLTLCEVDANTTQPLKVVCGATNVRPGLKVALAQIGAQLPGGFKIKESKLRGELSQGMLCSEIELGLADNSQGIMELPADAPIGVNLRDYLLLDDLVLDIDLTPNRADCFSVLGLAREVAALNQLPLLSIPIETQAPKIDDRLPVQVHEPQACPRYRGRIIRGINHLAPTPVWMTERLRRAGIRSRYPVVDVLNYVMLELGQPMHAFDLAKIESEIQVRYLREGETLRLLDGQVLTFKGEKVLIIADKNKPLALAGIMGGQESAVGTETRDVFLESAFFSPLSLSGIARNYGVLTDSSQRYERGVDPQLQERALDRATALILSIAGGEVGPVVEQVDAQTLPKAIILRFQPTKLKQLTGLSLEYSEMETLLQSVGIVRSKESPSSSLQTLFEVPSHRFDIREEVDLVEEILRLYGYEHLQAEIMQVSLTRGSSNAREDLSKLLGQFFRDRGYHETINYSFVDPKLQEAIYSEAAVMQLLNPISSELSQMRLSLWPGLLASMVYNLHRQQGGMRLFEQGVVFDLKTGTLIERACIAGLVMGEEGQLNWGESPRCLDYFDLKGDLEALFSLLKQSPVRFVPATHDALHPTQAAKIEIASETLGWIGVLHPRFNEALSVTKPVVLFEIELDVLLQARAALYSKISKYPRIRRDLSFLVDEQVTAMQIEETVREVVDKAYFYSFDVFDVYRGEGIPSGKKSMAIAVILQDKTKTLVDQEINAITDAIIKALENKLGILLRDLENRVC